VSELNLRDCAGCRRGETCLLLDGLLATLLDVLDDLDDHPEINAHGIRLLIEERVLPWHDCPSGRMFLTSVLLRAREEETNALGLRMMLRRNVSALS